MSTITLSHTLTATDLKEIDDLAAAKKMSREKAALQLWELKRRSGAVEVHAALEKSTAKRG